MKTPRRPPTLTQKVQVLKEHHPCAGRTAYGGYPCKHWGVVKLGGKWWCRRHARALTSAPSPA